MEDKVNKARMMRKQIERSFLAVLGVGTIGVVGLALYLKGTSNPYEKSPIVQTNQMARATLVQLTWNKDKLIQESGQGLIQSLPYHTADMDDALRRAFPTPNWSNRVAALDELIGKVEYVLNETGKADDCKLYLNIEQRKLDIGYGILLATMAGMGLATLYGLCCVGRLAKKD
jgi:hypothetical protein